MSAIFNPGHPCWTINVAEFQELKIAAQEHKFNVFIIGKDNEDRFFTSITPVGNPKGSFPDDDVLADLFKASMLNRSMYNHSVLFDMIGQKMISDSPWCQAYR